jgi:hypothetical protein
MPDFSSETFGSSDKTIDFDADYHTFIRLIALINHQTNISVSWDHLERVLELATRFQFILVPTLVSHLILRVPSICSDPWTLFVFASKYDFLFLAKMAMTRFHNGTTIYAKNAWEVRVETLELIPNRYAFALLQGMAAQSCP